MTDSNRDPRHDLLTRLGPLLRAECAAEAPAAGVEPADLEQAVWVRLLTDPAAAAAPGATRLRRAVRAEARTARRRARREVPFDPTGHGPPAGTAAAGTEQGVEQTVLTAETHRALRAAVRRLPGRCPGLLGAFLGAGDPTYREIAGKLGISQGSMGPVRSRCLGCLRRMLTGEIAAPGPGGWER
ncbi:RNA polymerase sigma factor [Streptomyces mashuensis]|uniref:RNA polymerase sigma factor n=1 Tax=Streptomyces mashuensis TaxID=33904 RepID=A0A919ECC6_9ACTN|nr:sigma-70 family RNA polymerase sigma factor [Streptomyces mashuensis]GHF39689.1 RNA polymerase sigma factor [Streptomyces mashuensis]